MSELTTSANPFAIMVAAHLQALATQKSGKMRLKAKVSLIRSLLRLGMSTTDVDELFRLIDWLMGLSHELSKSFWEEVLTMEREANMPYISSIERFAREAGLEKGREESILAVLSARFGDVPDNVAAAISKVTPKERLAELIKVAAVTPSLEAFGDYLRTLG